MLKKLEKYEIEEEIGHGGMATVYRAHDTVLDRLVALKVMHPHLRGADEARRRFHREAQSVARLRHPRVLEIYDFSNKDSNEAYIAAELLTGPTLKQWREDAGEIPAEIAACFVIEIAKALEAAHEAKIVHRDVKPENVLLHENRTLKLTDFGIADMVDAQSMTATGQILGSPGHMAPEQIEGGDTDARTDLFSLGTVLYYLATGRLPFTGRNPHQVLKRIMDAEYADPLRVSPAIGGTLRGIIIKSLATDPAERYQSAVEFREALEDFVRLAGIEEPESTLAAYMADPETVAEELRAETIDRLIDRGQRASDAGDVPTALDCYNRVLALDDGNERVMKLIERVGMDRRRRRALFAGAGLIAFGLIAGGGAWMLWNQPPEPDEPDPIVAPIASEPTDAGAEELAEGEADAGAEEAAAAPDAGVVVAEADAEDAGAELEVIRTPRMATVRRVRLRSPAVGVTVSVDGGDATPIQSQVFSRDLTPGMHSVVLSPIAGAAVSRSHQTTTTQVRVPATGDAVLQLHLDPKDAQVRIDRCPPRGRVVVAGSTRNRGAAGPCGEVIFVPMIAQNANVSITVSAPGYQSQVLTPRLVAGAPTQNLQAELRPAEGEGTQAAQ